MVCRIEESQPGAQHLAGARSGAEQRLCVWQVSRRAASERRAGGRHNAHRIRKLRMHPSQALENVVVLLQVIAIPNGLVMRNAVPKHANAVEPVKDLRAGCHVGRALSEGEAQRPVPQARPLSAKIAVRMPAQRDPEAEVQLRDQMPFRLIPDPAVDCAPKFLPRTKS